MWHQPGLSHIYARKILPVIDPVNGVCSREACNNPDAEAELRLIA
jgi:hypothetical protein